MRKALYILGILNDSDIDWLVTTGQRREVQDREVLVTEGQASDFIYIVTEGAFAVTTSGRELAQLFTGEVIGEISFVDSNPPSATVTAKEYSAVLAIPRTKLFAKLAGDLPFASRFYRSLAVFLADRLRTANAALAGGAPNPSNDDLNFDALDNISVAGIRFDWIQRRLRSE